MFSSLGSGHIDFDLPAPITVGGILFAGALAKEGYSEWAMAGLAALYLLYLVTQYCRQSVVRGPAAPSRQAVGRPR